MNTHADKTSETKKDTAAVDASQRPSGGKSALPFVDNRPGAVAQKKLNEAVKQRKAVQDGSSHAMPETSPIQKKANLTGLPDTLKSGIENLSGYSMDDVKVHYNSDKPAQLQAHAYAQGTDIHIASGQEKHLAHEAWHVVQQKQGRVKPTAQLKGKVNINDDRGLEHEADLMGSIALHRTGEPAQLKGQSSGTAVIQRKIGFELQPTNIIIEKKDPEEDTWKEFTGKKRYKVRYGKVNLERDGKNPEFTTDAFDKTDNPKDIYGAVGVIPEGWANPIIPDIYEQAFAEYQNEYNAKKEQKDQAKKSFDIIKVSKDSPVFDVQTTVSLPLEKVPSIMDKIYEQVKETTPRKDLQSSSKEIKMNKIKAPDKREKGNQYNAPIDKVPFRRRKSQEYIIPEKLQSRKGQADVNVNSLLSLLENTRTLIHTVIHKQGEVTGKSKEKVLGFFEMSLINLKALVNSAVNLPHQPGIKSGTPVLIKSHLGGLFQTLTVPEKGLVSYVLEQAGKEEEFTQWYHVQKRLSWETINRFKFRPIDYYKRLAAGADPMAYFEGMAEANTKYSNVKSELGWYKTMRGHHDLKVHQKEEEHNLSQKEALQDHKGNYDSEYAERTQELRKTWDQRLDGNPDLAVIELRELGSIGLTSGEIAKWAEASFIIYQAIESK